MTSDRRRYLVLGAVLLMGFGIALLLLVGGKALFGSNDERGLVTLPKSPTPATQSAPTPIAQTESSPASAALQARLAKALTASLRSAPGGKGSGAIWVEGAADPTVVLPENEAQIGRMWSISKPVTAIAALQLANALRDGDPMWAYRAELEAAAEKAIRRSSNCAQREVVIFLEAMSNGSTHSQKIQNAQGNFTHELEQAGVTDSTSAQTGTDGSCKSYLAARKLPPGWQPTAGDLLLGTSEWTQLDASKWMGTLLRSGPGATVPYLRAGQKVLEMMRMPKLPPDPVESEGETFTASIGWGATDGLQGLEMDQPVAYKAGWGGSARRNFVASQVAGIVIGGKRIAVAVGFRPTAIPSSDDPGQTVAPKAVTQAFASLVPVLAQTGGTTG